MADPSPKRRSPGWARLIAKVYEVDPLVCTRCGQRMSIVAFVTDPFAFRRILDHLGLSPPQHEKPPPIREVIRVAEHGEGGAHQQNGSEHHAVCELACELAPSRKKTPMDSWRRIEKAQVTSWEHASALLDIPFRECDRHAMEEGDSRGSSALRIARLAAIAVSVAVALIYTAQALALIRYRWDWSPDEGLSLDYARRMVQSPSTLYVPSVVPIPLVYTPLLAVMLAPITMLAREPLGAARVVALGWTAFIVGAVYALIRPLAGRPLALVTAALVLAPLDVSFWHMLVRIDGPMLVFWLAAAIWLLPRRLERGADRLTGRRVALGAALLLAGVLTKPTVVAHGTPLVLGWLLVDVGSAVSLALVLGLSGGLTALLLNLATHGGFLWVNGLWKFHPLQPGLLSFLLAEFGRLTWPVLAVVLASLVLAAVSRTGPLRDAAMLLVAGGLVTIPAMAKWGAWWNYMLPAYVALVVLAGRWLGQAVAAHPRRQVVEATVLWGVSAVALALATTRVFPLPSREDGATADAFYRFIEQRVRETGQRLLTTRPDYAYFRAGQPVEIDGSLFVVQAAFGLPGTEIVLARLRARDYAVIAIVPGLWPQGPFEPALAENYQAVAKCRLGFFYGHMNHTLYVPKGKTVAFDIPPGARCLKVEGTEAGR